jgi:hypothetical protein
MALFVPRRSRHRHRLQFLESRASLEPSAASYLPFWSAGVEPLLDEALYVRPFLAEGVSFEACPWM